MFPACSRVQGPTLGTNTQRVIPGLHWPGGYSCPQQPLPPHCTLPEHPAGTMSAETTNTGGKLGQEEHKGSMGTAPATAKSKPLCVSPASPPGALHPARVSAPWTTDPAPSTHPQYPAAPHHCTLTQCLTQPQLCSPSPSPGSTVPSPVGTLGGLLPPPGKQQGTMMGAGEDKAKIALRWQEERVTSPGCPRETGLGGQPATAPLALTMVSLCLAPRGRGGSGLLSPRAQGHPEALCFCVSAATTNLFLLPLPHFVPVCRGWGG